MPRKRKATLSRQSNIQVAIAKRRRFRAGNIDISDEDDLQRLSGDESMNNSDDEDALAQPDASTSQSGELSFQLDIEQGVLDAAPQEGTFLQWDLITDAAMIDGAGEEGTAPAEVLPDDLANGVLELDDEPGEIDDLGEHEVLQYGQVLDAADTIPIPPNPAPSLPQPAPPIPPSARLKGYEYSEFRPQRYDRTLLGEQRLAPTQADALKALADLQKVLHPARDTGRGYKDPDMDLWHRARIEGMLTMLNLFINDRSLTYNCWGASACQAAVGIGRGRHCARRLCDLNRQYLADREVLPINPYGDWNESLLVNEDIVNEINIYLLSLGNEITAKKLMDFLHRPDIKEKYGIERDISHKTACRYLHTLGYRFQYTPKGQYVDGHEREDVVAYRKNVFLVKWRKYANRMASWDKELREHLPPQGTRRVIIWFHDESIFYANDRRKKGWYHKDASAKPYAKGEGASLMIADYVSADFGWLISPDGTQSARRIFKPGKNRDGYFTSQEILEQADDAITILQECYPEYDHVLIYDNATTHLKRPDDALSAKKMPKGTPKPGTNWGIEVSKRDPVTGNIVYDKNANPEKIKIRMRDGEFYNSTPQPLYYPMDHPDPHLRGVFKGMEVILLERGYSDQDLRDSKGKKLLAQCNKFKCAPGATKCCMRRILYNEPDFANAESLLETQCRARGVDVFFLPKFHCELNFIEQCWGRAKSVYRTYPPSTKEDDLVRNTLSALDSVPLRMMRKFATRSRRFMDAYDKGLNGKQAAWASRKYRGHRVPPNIDKLLEELEKNNVK